MKQPNINSQSWCQAFGKGNQVGFLFCLVVCLHAKGQQQIYLTSKKHRGSISMLILILKYSQLVCIELRPWYVMTVTTNLLLINVLRFRVILQNKSSCGVTRQIINSSNASYIANAHKRRICYQTHKKSLCLCCSCSIKYHTTKLQVKHYIIGTSAKLV